MLQFPGKYVAERLTVRMAVLLGEIFDEAGSVETLVHDGTGGRRARQSQMAESASRKP